MLCHSCGIAVKKGPLKTAKIGVFALTLYRGCFSENKKQLFITKGLTLVKRSSIFGTVVSDSVVGNRVL